MPRILELLRSRVRAIGRTDWEEMTGPRWAGQILAGLLPGLMLLGIITHFSSQSGSTVGGRGRSAASVVPLLSASAIADTAAFHRRLAPHEPTRAAEFRHPRIVEDLPRAVPIAIPVALPVDFRAPRVEWHHLSRQMRSVIDNAVALGDAQPTQRIVLHGSGQSRGSMALLGRYQAAVHGQAHAYDFVIGNGRATRDGAVEVSPRWSVAAHGDGSIHVCLVGDFHRSRPTASQLAALDEVLDYLSLKLGRLPVTVHGDGQCLGVQFPADEVIEMARD